MTLRRMLPFLLLNVLVSATVVLAMLFWWDSRQPETAPLIATTAADQTTAAAAAAVAGVAPTPLVAAPADVAAEAPVEGAVDGPTTHVVQAGETLGIISNTYDTSIEDIMEANGLDNPDLLNVGQELIIPIGGVAVATPTAAVAEAPATAAGPPTPIATEAAATTGQADIRIAAVEGAGTLDGELVQIANSGTTEQALVGWTIRDEDGNTYTFGQISLFGEGAAIRLHTAAGTDSPADLYWGLAEPAWRSGEVLTLQDASEQVVVRFTIP